MPGRDRPPSGSRYPGCRLPGSPPSAPFRPGGAALGSLGSTSPCAASGCAARPCRLGSANLGRDSRCAGPVARCSSRRGLHRSSHPPPTPSDARPQSQSSPAADQRRHSSPSAREGSSSRRSSGVSWVRGWSSQPDPTRQPPMTTRQLHHHPGHDQYKSIRSAARSTAVGSHPVKRAAWGRPASSRPNRMRWMGFVPKVGSGNVGGARRAGIDTGAGSTRAV